MLIKIIIIIIIIIIKIIATIIMIIIINIIMETIKTKLIAILLSMLHIYMCLVTCYYAVRLQGSKVSTCCKCHGSITPFSRDLPSTRYASIICIGHNKIHF
jgi:hypothetical protein